VVTGRVGLHVQLYSSVDLEIVSELDSPNLGWIVSAEYATRSRQTLAAKIKAAAGLIVDPVTWRLDPSLRWMRAGDGGVKPIYRRLVKGFRLPIDDQPWRERSPDHLERHVWEVLEFQEQHLDTSRFADEAELFPDMLPPSIGRSRPDRLFGPTILVRSIDTLRDQLLLWSATPSEFRELPVDLVLAITPRLLVDADALALIDAAIPLGRRLWLFVPRFRELLRTRSGIEVSSAVRTAVRRLAERGPVGLLGPGHHLSMLIKDGVDAIGFGLHLEGGAERKAGGGPALPYAYVTAAHGLAPYGQIADIVRSLEVPDEFAHWVCPEATCVARFESLGARGFAKEMFAVRPTRNGLQATAEAHARQRRHGLRARLWELARIESMDEAELVRVLASEARRTPFERAGADLLSWLDAFVSAGVRTRR
jgi:hypothetical protein